MLSKLRILIGALLMAGAVSVFAMDLDQAKQQGLVGEQMNGYLGIVSGASAEVKALVSDINDKRKQNYQSIAKKNSLDLGTVEKLAGQKAIERTAPGNFVQSSSGSWVKK